MVRKIPKSLTLDVALEYCQQAKASPATIEDLRKISAEYHGKDRVFNALKERMRIADQRAAFALILDHPHFEAIRAELLQRAWDLLDGGKDEACDAILEFLPEADADKLLNEYFAEDSE